MIANPNSVTDRASFNGAMTAVRADHQVLRRLAAGTTQRGYRADDAMSLAEAMVAHEAREASLFDLPFITHPPKDVTSTAARARRRCIEFTTGDFKLPDSSAAAALFVDALLAHLAAEEAWFASEDAYEKERLRILA